MMLQSEEPDFPPISPFVKLVRYKDVGRLLLASCTVVENW